MKKVAAVVVTYNRKELLFENIGSLLSQTKASLMDIVVVDNASTDGTCQYISDYIDEKKIIYLNTGKNLGGAGGFHLGLKYAAENGYDFAWVMDDDCIPMENALEEFLRWDKKLGGRYGFLSGKVLWRDGNLCKMNLQRKTLTSCVTDFSPPCIPIAMASFVSLFIPIRIVHEQGLPLKEFFIWTDDWEYTRRISRKHRCYLITSSAALHKSSSNIGADISTDAADRLYRYRYLYRNDVYLYRREGIKGFAYEAVRLSAHLLRVLFRAKNNRLERMGYVIKGTKEGLKFRPEIEFPGKEDNG